MDTSDIDNSDISSLTSSSETENENMGQHAYLYEPEYTESELETITSAREARLQEINENPRKNDTSWCLCSNCMCLPLLSECMCCHEFSLYEENIESGHCISEKDDFRLVCLNRVVLETSYINFLRYKRYRGRAPDVLTNSQYRLMAYRQFVSWVRKGQALGKKNRVPLPSCVVKTIREEFPEATEEYEGFHHCTTDLSDSD